MKTPVLAILILISKLSFAGPRSLEAYLKKPLIVGASISVGKHAVSPSRKLALGYTSASNIKTIAQGGKMGKDVLKNVTPDIIKKSSIIIGMDLFFWDSSQVSVAGTQKAIVKIIEDAQNANIPILIGDIPTLRPGRQPSAIFLNLELQKACATYNQCVMMPLTKYYSQLATDGFLMVGERKYDLKELLPDGLHLSDIGSQYIADEMKGLLSELAKK